MDKQILKEQIKAAAGRHAKKSAETLPLSAYRQAKVETQISAAVLSGLALAAHYMAGRGNEAPVSPEFLDETLREIVEEMGFEIKGPKSSHGMPMETNRPLEQ